MQEQVERANKGKYEMFYNRKQNYPIENTRIYKFSDGRYFVSFDTRHTHEEFVGTREQILPALALRVKRIMHVR